MVSSFFGPAQGVAIRGAVPLHGLRSANALLQQVMFGMRIVGPGIAGIVYKFLGAHVCYWTDSASFLASGTLIASLALSRGLTPPVASDITTQLDADATQEAAPVAPSAAGGLSSILPDMKQGLRFIVHHAAMLFVILALSAAMFVIGCFAPLMAVYVRDTLLERTGTYAVISAMIGIGMLLGINLLNTFGKRLRDTLLVYSGLLGISVGLVLLTAIPHVWAAMLGNLICGISTAAIMVPAQTLIQTETPPALMGRVGSTVMSFIFTAQILGLVLSGLLATGIGVRHTFAVCAAMPILLAAAGKLWMHPAPSAKAV